MGRPFVDPCRVMEIVRRRLESNEDEGTRWDDGESSVATPLRDSPDLDLVNRRWIIPATEPPRLESRPARLIWRVLAPLRRLAARPLVVRLALVVLERYVLEERELLGSLARLQNDLVRRADDAAGGMRVLAGRLRGLSVRTDVEIRRCAERDTARWRDLEQRTARLERARDTQG